MTSPDAEKARTRQALEALAGLAPYPDGLQAILEDPSVLDGLPDILAALAASRARVEKLEELLQDARPLLGMSVRGSLGARADELLQESARD